MSFSSFLSNPDGSRYCVKPFVSHLRHYQNPDMPLGAFLETYCFDRSYNHPLPTSQSHQDIGGLSNMSSKPSNNNAYCPIPITDHGRRFCLGNTSVSLVIQTLEKPINSKNGEHILIWKYCPMCKATTELMPLSFEAQMMSYGMFLLILTYENKIVRRKLVKCDHSLHNFQFTCFGYGDQVAFFKLERILPHRIKLPPRKISLPDHQPKESILKDDLKK